MRYGFRTRLAVAACASAAIWVGCAKAPTCTISPVEIEELKEDVSGLDKDLSGVRDREKQLSDDLAAKQADLETKRGKPDELRKRLEELKRGSGRTEKPKAGDDKKPANKKESS